MLKNYTSKWGITNSSNGLSNLSLNLLRKYVPALPAAVLSVMLHRDMIEKIKKVSLTTVLVSLAAMLVLLLSDAQHALLSGYVFLILWSLDKVFLWYFNFDFGIASQLTIKKDAPKILRLAGLIFALFVLYIGAKGILELPAT